MKNRLLSMLLYTLLITVGLTVFFYVHECFPKPIRALTALLGTPVAIAAGISHYTGLGIPVYETPVLVVLANFVAAICMVWLGQKLIQKWGKHL